MHKHIKNTTRYFVFCLFVFCFLKPKSKSLREISKEIGVGLFHLFKVQSPVQLNNEHTDTLQRVTFTSRKYSKGHSFTLPSSGDWAWQPVAPPQNILGPSVRPSPSVFNIRPAAAATTTAAAAAITHVRTRSSPCDLAAANNSASGPPLSPNSKNKNFAEFSRDKLRVSGWTVIRSGAFHLNPVMFQNKFIYSI